MRTNIRLEILEAKAKRLEERVLELEGTLSRLLDYLEIVDVRINDRAIVVERKKVDELFGNKTKTGR